MLSVSYSLEILIAKAIHPARTTLQVIISPIPACSPLLGPSIFASCHALFSQQFDRLASTAWLTSTLVLFYLNPPPPLPPHLIALHGQKEVPAARQRLDEPQILEQVSVFGSSRMFLF